jgi:hypothetical protein
MFPLFLHRTPTNAKTFCGATDMQSVSSRAHQRLVKPKRARQEPKIDLPRIDGAQSSDDKNSVAHDLARMNERYAVVRIGGHSRVMYMETDSVSHCQIPAYQTIHDFITFHHNEKRDIGTPEKPKLIGIGKWWIDHPNRRQYDSVVFVPHPPGDKPTLGNVFNLWGGFACEPHKADWSLLRTHLLDNICAGNEAHFNYLLNWQARGVQQPEKQGEVAVVLQGYEGTGKGMCAWNYGRLFGPHMRHVSNPRHLVGNFNSHQFQCCLFYGDEAFFAGDRSHEGVLKALITEPTILVELKGIDSFQAPNRMKIILSSNSDWVVPAGKDARRFFVLNVSDAKKQDTEYFGAISTQMESGGREAYLYDLLHRDLSGFNIRDIPQTPALANQKMHTRRGIDALVEELASEGLLFEAHESNPAVAITTPFEGRKGFYQAAKSRFPELRHLTDRIINDNLRAEWGCTTWRESRRRGIRFPVLPSLRAMFNIKHGDRHWDQPDSDWGDA